MPALRTFERLGLPVLLALIGAALGWLYFGFAGDKTGSTRLLPATTTSAPAGVLSWQVDFAIEPKPSSTFTEISALPPSAWRPPRTPKSGLIGVLGAERPTWMRITWRNRSAQHVRGILATGDFFMDEVDFWIQDSAGEWRHERTGESAPVTGKSIASRQAAAIIRLPAESERVTYMRFADPVPISTSLEWWANAKNFYPAQLRMLIADGIYFGGLLALLFYNIVLWVRLRFADTGWYILYLGAMLGFLLLARAVPLAAGWATSSPGLETALVTAIAGTGIFLAQFARVFLELKTRLPRGDRLLRLARNGLILLAAGALTIPWSGYYLWMGIVAPACVLTHGLMAGLAIAAWRHGAPQARHFLLAFACVSLSGLALTGIWFGSIDARFDGLSAVMIGSALELLLLSLAIAARFAQTQQRLAEETEQRRAIEEAYADELEVEVRERTQELEAANRDKDRMLAALGHDLRSPLATLTRRAELFRNHSPTTEPLAKLADDATSSGRQILLLIEDIVLWARLRDGAKLPTRSLAAAEIVGPVVALHRAQAENHGLTLTTDIPDGLRVQTDLVLAQTIVRNLVGNALKFARSRIEVTARPVSDNRIQLTVRDDGPGLPAEALARLRSDGQDDGTSGMGLRLIREIAAALGATVVVTQPDNGGADISIVLSARAD